MKEKLTLSIDRETKRRAKRYARATGKSISEMVEEFLNQLSSEEQWEPPEGSVVEKLSGSLPIKDNRPYKEIIAETLSKKYEIDEDSD
ncbi:DUF6364 family protein [Aliifodinibius sp. S!AR15-10]|uniref:DUF6364 family protein n=1 Tax=Aliifodinibius sp. S!AR15-10 TaxID=2950437 RepID=UPI0028595327|nr:DUF6364 family protein [Aliifodinibius sp. S!AR15-10]MDR8391276.1 DUF6364 family protein [Aliifodinibius sp. S!AR15-10]